MDMSRKKQSLNDMKKQTNIEIELIVLDMLSIFTTTAMKSRCFPSLSGRLWCGGEGEGVNGLSWRV